MKKACLVVDRPYQNNRIFDEDSYLNRDDCLAFFRYLQAEFRSHGVELMTQDLCSQEAADFVIFNEVPADIGAVADPTKSCVLLFESDLILPRNWDFKNHQRFKYIFTWHDGYVDNVKYFKMNFSGPQKFVLPSFAEKTKFCTLIAGNKRVIHPHELYSKRVEAIRWFEAHHPESFEFYGMGWGFKTFTVPVISKVLNRATFLRRYFAEKWPSYKGAAADKQKILRDFKFSICYENAEGIPGYITEKIFDSLAAGCLPVYWGAPNIKQYVPETCFIDRTIFKSYEELYAFLQDMSEEEFNGRLAHIRSFFSGPGSQEFSPSKNAVRVVQRIINA